MKPDETEKLHREVENHLANHEGIKNVPAKDNHDDDNKDDPEQQGEIAEQGCPLQEVIQDDSIEFEPGQENEEAANPGNGVEFSPSGKSSSDIRD